MNNSVHEIILLDLKNELEADIRNAGAASEILDDSYLYRLIFLNYRKSNGQRGLRLTTRGLAMLEKIYRSFDVKVPEGNSLSGSDFLKMERMNLWPFFIDHKRMVFFEDIVGATMAMVDCDIKTCYEILGDRRSDPIPEIERI